MNSAVGWKNIPNELKQLRQWCVSNYTNPDPLQRKAPRVARGDAQLASVLVKENWSTFDEAAEFAWNKGTGDWCIGLILTKEDGYCVIDLDVKDCNNAPNKPHTWTTQTQIDEYWRIAKDTESYVETSLGGKSLHVIVKANIGLGVHTAGVEIYSQERYIICTGNVVIDKPIREAQMMMDATVRNLRSLANKCRAELIEFEEVDSDTEVFEKAIDASNGHKFSELCEGRWQQFGYPSQSEADLALMSMFTFYSNSNEQCRRLFRATALGQREKSQKDNRYLDFTLASIRGRQEVEKTVEIAALHAQGEFLLKKMAELPPIRNKVAAPVAVPMLPPPTNVEPITPANADPVAIDLESRKKAKFSKAIAWPSGAVGYIAQFIYNNAPRPVKEVAIVAAFGYFAGLCGKVFTLPQSGLNIYMILVGQSAVGKEAMHSGVASILEEMREANPACMNYVDFSDFASGPALIKACIGNPSFVNVNGEWGRKLKRLADDNGRDAAMQSLRTTMTNLYQKSGPTSIVGGINYSKKEDNVLSVSGVAYSMIGETTPTTYYEALTEGMMEDGFLSRFTMLEYTGMRPQLNKKPAEPMDKEFKSYLCGMVSYVSERVGSRSTIQLTFDKKAKDLFDEFDIECDNEINGHVEESWRQMWNRAHLKALRYAGIMAAADNYVLPVVKLEHAEWAIDLIRRDIDLMQRKLTTGDIGMGDDSRERKLLSILSRYVRQEDHLEPYAIPANMFSDGVVQHKYLQIRVARINSFYKHRLGATTALAMTIKSLIDMGYMMEVPKEKLLDYGFQGKCYRILDLP